MMIHEFTTNERAKLNQAYEILMDLTIEHHHDCPCWLCKGRAEIAPEPDFPYIAFITSSEGDADYDKAMGRYFKQLNDLSK